MTLDFNSILSGTGLAGAVFGLIVLMIKQNHTKEMKQIEQQNEIDMKQLEQQYEKEKQAIQVDIIRVESHKQDIDKLCDKIDKLVDTIHEQQAKDIQKTVKIENGLNEMKDMYIRIAKKQDDIREKVEAIDIRTQMCPNVLHKEKEEERKQ